MTESLLKRMEEKIAGIQAMADEVPGAVIIHRFENNFANVEYMSAWGLKKLNTTLQELQEMGAEYYSNFFNPEDVEDYRPKMAALLERNDENETFSFFQQVRASVLHEWEWYFSTVRIFMRDDDGNPFLTITIAYPIDPLHHVTHKVNRLLEENTFLRNNYARFSSLTQREKEILRELVLGKSSNEIAETLFISINTVETHRKNIKRKLEAGTSFELSEYARAYDLI
jgi:DNA-binding CsgD family transcriptional regulator